MGRIGFHPVSKISLSDGKVGMSQLARAIVSKCVKKLFLCVSFSASTIFFTHPSQETDGFHSTETGNIPGQSWLAERVGHRDQLTEINEGFQLHLLVFIASSSDNFFALAVYVFFFFFDGEKVFHLRQSQPTGSFFSDLHYLIIWLLQNHAMLPPGTGSWCGGGFPP